MSKKKTYGLGEESGGGRFPAPVLPYLPQNPKSYHPNIGLIGCGGIAQSHLAAYKKAGYRVVALCDINQTQAESRRKEFYPKADIYTDYRAVLERRDIEVVDIATHPAVREAIIRDAIHAGKHILSQKPFVLDLTTGRKLVAAADKAGVRLAVNQNGRWAPHFSYLRQAVAQGIAGDVLGVHFTLHWNHGWIAGTAFDSIKHVLLYDFAIHWFDILNCFMGGRPAKRVFATLAKASSQKAKPPLLGQVLIDYEGAQASMSFDACADFGSLDQTIITGTKATLISQGPNLNQQKVTLQTSAGIASPRLRGAWFPEGFQGTMAELLCAVEEDREPANSARSNLDSLALCFAAVASAENCRPVVPGKATTLAGSQGVAGN